MTTHALQIRVKTDILAAARPPFSAFVDDEVRRDICSQASKKKEDKQKTEGSMSTEEKKLTAINRTNGYDDNSSDDDDSLGGSYDEADDEDYISDDDNDDSLINNKTDGIADFDEFIRNIPNDDDLYYTGYVPEMEGGFVVLPPSFFA